MSWLSAFSAIHQAKFARQFADPRLRHRPQRKPEASELGAGGGEQEIALVAIRVGGPVERPSPALVVAADDIVAGRQQVGAEVVRGGEQIGEFHVLVAGDAWHRGLAGDVGAGERLDHLLSKALLVIEHIMGNRRAARRRPVHRGCPARRNRRPCDASLRRGRRAASSRRRRRSLRAASIAAVTDKSTPPDIATTTRVSAGALRRPRLLSAPRAGGAREGASMSDLTRPNCRATR